ncbi:Ig-like domain-containing protein [Marinobacter alkaliphilus]|uniref:Ig-like domain-containing protein n=1 Tax=Marinobacter alkaliphilus TaxID=254719 RepID=A0ABZ3DZB0_9GAMM
MTMTKRTLTALGIASSLALAGCGGSGEGPGDPRVSVPQDPTRDQTEQAQFCASSSSTFAVTEFVPADGASDVALNSNVRITFNANIDPASVAAHVRLLNGVNQVALEEGSPRVMGKSVVLNPQGNLSANTEHTIEALSGLQADCPDNDTAKTLGVKNAASFTTGDSTQVDTTSPTMAASSPQNGETLASPDARIFMEFSEPVDPTTVNSDSFIVQELDDNGNVVGVVSGAIGVVGNSVEFTPDQSLKGQTYYRVVATEGVTDLAGNGLESSDSVVFRTGGLVLALNEGVINQIPLLGAALNELGGTLLDPLAFGDSEDGLNSLDNALILKLPLIEGLADAINGDTQLGGMSTTNVDGVDFLNFLTGVVAVCDPKSVNNGEPGVNCTLALDLGLGQSQITALADAFTGGNPEQVPDLLLGLFEGLASGDLSTVPPELADLFEENDRGLLQLRLVDDNGLPLPEPLEDGLLTVLDAVAQIPVLGELTNQQDAKALADIGLLQGSLVRVNLGGLASITALDGFETFVGPNGVLNLGGALFDTLLALAPEDGGSGGMPNPEDLPLIGELISLLDAGGFPDGGEFGLADEFIERLQNLFEMDTPFEPEDLPLLGDLLTLLDPANFGEGDLPVIGELIEQLMALGDNQEELENLPLVGDLINLFSNPEDALSDLASLFDPSNLTELPETFADLFSDFFNF